MFFGMARFVDSPKELWESIAWASSIRCSSGQYAYYPNTTEPVFPSDLVRFKCNDTQCLCQTMTQKPHLGQIVAFRRDFRIYREHSSPEGSIILKVQRFQLIN
ncbi:hypothetical protein P152DRAFT_175792 [Eremomyces bilateralis CBS 781.70]|uniref:Uncharacterized protein n=1 Tax=Eremomyces bilateralis CBS 781.70 TaxID=1392243 RepID=A0A6G1FTG4_9PEZI|nr:uncharacterized protein P152DRAFT_175792 [Eremomyces bilateralis CBS 781.70]KAF1809087.1 hypothetical protein P152DRAFT_175792 [Eremomyces bilateralis CBS 781.70]